MFVSRVVFSRVSRSSLNQCRGISSSRNQLPQIFTSDSLLVSGQSTNKWVPCQVNAMHNMFTNASQQFWYSSSASTQPDEKKKNSQEETNYISKEAKAETKVVDAAARASSVAKIDSSKDTTAGGAVPLLKDTAPSRIKMFRWTFSKMRIRR